MTSLTALVNIVYLQLVWRCLCHERSYDVTSRVVDRRCDACVNIYMYTTCRCAVSANLLLMLSVLLIIIIIIIMVVTSRDNSVLHLISLAQYYDSGGPIYATDLTQAWIFPRDFFSCFCDHWHQHHSTDTYVHLVSLMSSSMQQSSQMMLWFYGWC